MAQATISIRMDANLKRNFEREPLSYPKITKEELERRIADLEAGKGVRVSLEELEYVASAPNDAERKKRLGDLRVSKGFPRSVGAADTPSIGGDSK